MHHGTLAAGAWTAHAPVTVVVARLKLVNATIDCAASYPGRVINEQRHRLQPPGASCRPGAALGARAGGRRSNSACPSEPLRIMLAEWGIVPVDGDAIPRTAPSPFSSWGDGAGYVARRVRSQPNRQAGAQRRRPGSFERSPGHYLFRPAVTRNRRNRSQKRLSRGFPTNTLCPWATPQPARLRMER